MAYPFIQKIIGEMNDNENVTILVTGTGGVGKSTLVNALVGEEVTQAEDSVEAVTETVHRIRVTRKGIEIYIIDTPGFGDMDRENEDTIRQAIQEGGQIDLLLFCLNMKHGRLDGQVIEGMKNLRKILGEDIWKRAMFVLTHANEYDDAVKFNKKLNQWKGKLKNKMKKTVNINPEIADKIPIVPTGNSEQPQLLDRSSWISEFWIQGFRRMGFRAMLKLVFINQKRIERSTQKIKLSQDMYENREHQPLFTCYMSWEERSIKHYYLLSVIVNIIVESMAFSNPEFAQFFKVGTAAMPLIENSIKWLLSWVGIAYGKRDCFGEVIYKTLLITLYEEHPQLFENIHQAVKDEL